MPELVHAEFLIPLPPPPLPQLTLLEVSSVRQLSFSCVVSIFGKQWAEFALGKISKAVLWEMAPSWQQHRGRGETIARFYLTRFSLLRKLNSRLSPDFGRLVIASTCLWGFEPCTLLHSSFGCLCPVIHQKIKFQHIEFKDTIGFY